MESIENEMIVKEIFIKWWGKDLTDFPFDYSVLDKSIDLDMIFEEKSVLWDEWSRLITLKKEIGIYLLVFFSDGGELYGMTYNEKFSNKIGMEFGKILKTVTMIARHKEDVIGQKLYHIVKMLELMNVDKNLFSGVKKIL